MPVIGLSGGNFYRQGVRVVFMFSRSPSSSSSERSLPMSPPTRGRGSTMKSPQVIQASPKTKPSPARTAAARKAAVAAARYDL